MYKCALQFVISHRSRDSIGGVATRLHVERSEVSVQAGEKFFSSPKWLHRLWGPPRLLFTGYQGSFLEVKLLGRNVDHTPPTTAEVKNEWCFTFILPICLHSVNRGNFTSFAFYKTLEGDSQDWKIILWTFMLKLRSWKSLKLHFWYCTQDIQKVIFPAFMADLCYKEAILVPRHARGM
jgi:hypothetical protein